MREHVFMEFNFVQIFRRWRRERCTMALQTTFQASPTSGLQEEPNSGIRKRISLHEVSYERETFRNGHDVAALWTTNQNLVPKSAYEMEKGQQTRDSYK